MLMTNPRGERYNVTHPSRNEDGNVLVPNGYWHVAESVRDYEVVDPRSSQVVYATDSRLWGRVVAWWLGHGCECMERVEWLDVAQQRYEMTAWDPDEMVWRELPE